MNQKAERVTKGKRNAAEGRKHFKMQLSSNKLSSEYEIAEKVDVLATMSECLQQYTKTRLDTEDETRTVTPGKLWWH